MVYFSQEKTEVELVWTIRFSIQFVDEIST